MVKQEIEYKYKKELSDILYVFNVHKIKDIPEKPYRWRAGAINEFLKDLSILDASNLDKKIPS